MAFFIRPQRFLDRLQMPVAPGEALRVESVLAWARVFLAFGTLLAIFGEPGWPARYATLVAGLVATYAAYSAGVLAFLRVRSPSRALRLGVHGADFVFGALILLLTGGPSSPFFVFFFFLLLAAAYRWGLRETLLSAVSAVAILFLVGLLVMPDPLQLGFFLEGEVEGGELIIRTTFLLIMGVLLGYLAEEEKQLRGEATLLARISAKARGESSLRATFEAVFGEVLQVLGVLRALLVVQETASGRVFLWDARRQGPRVTVELGEVDAEERDDYLFPIPAAAWFQLRRPERGANAFDIMGVDSEGRRQSAAPLQSTPSALGGRPFGSLLGVSAVVGDEFSVRLMLLDPPAGEPRNTELRFLQSLIRQVGPAIYTVYLLRRLRRRASAVERARVARELHDGVIQSLISLEMQVDVLRRHPEGLDERLADELGRIQQLLHQEVVSLRELMQEMMPPKLEPYQLLDYLAELTDRFQRETGIRATFTSDLQEVTLPPRVCRELARVAQEALVNVRKHSGARHVVVRMGCQDGTWQLVVDDDGRGFPFEGRYSQQELDRARRGPLVIKERVRSIGGELAVESTPGRGARLEVTLRQPAHG